MNEIIAIARNTFKEAIRNRILYIILIFALLLILFSGVVSQLTISSRMKIVMDMGFSAISLFGVAIAIFVGVSLVYNELEKKTIYTIVSKPIGRWQFLLGKYFGLLLTVLVNIFVMTLFFLATVHYHTQVGGDHGFFYVLCASIGKAFVTFFYWGAYELTSNIMPVIALSCLEVTIVTAFAILFSSFSTPTLSMFFTILTFVAGRLNYSIVDFADYVSNEATREAARTGAELAIPASHNIALAVAHVVPNLSIFQKAVEQAIHEPAIHIWWGSIVYGLVYASGIVCLSILIFNQRNFK